MKSMFAKIAFLIFVVSVLMACTTSKKDVKEAWEKVDADRVEAQKVTRQYAVEQKKEFEKNAAARLKDFESKLTSLRTETVQARDAQRERLQDRVWQLEREITDAREDLARIKKRDVAGWEGERMKLDDKLATINSIFVDSGQLAH